MTPHLITEWGIALIIGALAAITIIIALAMARDRRHRVPPCLFCAGDPYKGCTCREDCGVQWCQAYDPGCPWCDGPGDPEDPCDCDGHCGRPRCQWREDSAGMLRRWEDEPPVLRGRDPVTAEIERWLEEGKDRG